MSTVQWCKSHAHISFQSKVIEFCKTFSHFDECCAVVQVLCPYLVPVSSYWILPTQREQSIDSKYIHTAVHVHVHVCLQYKVFLRFFGVNLHNRCHDIMAELMEDHSNARHTRTVSSRLHLMQNTTALPLPPDVVKLHVGVDSYNWLMK